MMGTANAELRRPTGVGCSDLFLLGCFIVSQSVYEKRKSKTDE